MISPSPRLPEPARKLCRNLRPSSTDETWASWRVADRRSGRELRLPVRENVAIAAACVPKASYPPPDRDRSADSLPAAYFPQACAARIHRFDLSPAAAGGSEQSWTKE